MNHKLCGLSSKNMKNNHLSVLYNHCKPHSCWLLLCKNPHKGLYYHPWKNSFVWMLVCVGNNSMCSLLIMYPSCRIYSAVCSACVHAHRDVGVNANWEYTKQDLLGLSCSGPSHLLVVGPILLRTLGKGYVLSLVKARWNSKWNQGETHN